jgi:hypothetical protein
MDWKIINCGVRNTRGRDSNIHEVARVPLFVSKEAEYAPVSEKSEPHEFPLRTAK